MDATSELNRAKEQAFGAKKEKPQAAQPAVE
jgi:hypothetical protein